MNYTKQQLVDIRSFLIDLSFDNLVLQGDVKTATACCKLLMTVDGLLEGNRTVSEEAKLELAKFIEEVE